MKIINIIRIFINKIFNKKLEIYQKNDISLYYRRNTKDEYILNEIYNLDEYDIDNLGLNDNSLVVDIGAQIGCFAIKVGKIVKKGRIYCYEPNSNNPSLTLC